MRNPGSPTNTTVAERVKDLDEATLPPAGAPVRAANGLPVTRDHDQVTKDVRRPNLLAALRQASAPQRLGRLVSLLALDLAAVWGAIFTALAVKDLIKGGFVLDRVTAQAWDYLPFVFLVTALLFARSGLYGRREVRPGLAAIVSSLFCVVVMSLVFALVNGLEFSSYYIFYGGFVFGLVWVGSLRWLYE